MNVALIFQLFLIFLCIPAHCQSEQMFLFIGPDLIVDSNIELPNSVDETQGNILKNGSRFIHNSGLANTFVGFDAGSFDVVGMGNAGFGTDSLLNIEQGMGNTALGFSTLVENTDGNGNTVAGVMALSRNQTGNLNTSFGAFSLFNNNGSNNIALGAYAGSDVIDGINNVYIAHSGNAFEDGVIRIGDPALHTSFFAQGIFNNMSHRLGALVEVDAEGQLSCVTSSLRHITSVQPLKGVPSIVELLTPISFRYDEYDNNRYYGLAAEDVARYYPELVVVDENDEPYAVRYDSLTALLLDELQKQNALIVALTKRIDALEKQ